MGRSVGLVALGVVLVLSALVVAVGAFAVGQDTDYVYRIDRSGFCAEVASPTPEPGQGEGFVYHHRNLSDAGRRHVERALADGRYVVDDRSDTAPEFSFTSDNVAAGEGCYAVRYEGRYYALRTERVYGHGGLGTTRTVLLVAGALAAAGVLALLGGAVSALLVAERSAREQTDEQSE